MKNLIGFFLTWTFAALLASPGMAQTSTTATLGTRYPRWRVVVESRSMSGLTLNVFLGETNLVRITHLQKPKPAEKP